jgi:TRAP-type C4-dicarboxylate transport system permease small subunit
MKTLFKWFSRTTEFIAALMLAAIFVTFLIQIFSRYAAKIAWMMPIPQISDWMASLQPIGWTVNLISLIWVWAVFFGCAFIVRERDHVTFDILYLSLPRTGRRILAYLSSIGIVAAMLYALPAMWDVVFDNRLMQLKKIQTLRMPITGDQIAIKWLFASVVLLMVVAIIRYSWQIATITRDGPPTGEIEEIVTSSSVVEDRNQ